MLEIVEDGLRTACIKLNIQLTYVSLNASVCFDLMLSLYHKSTLFFNGLSYAHQGCIYLIKIQKKKTLMLRNIIAIYNIGFLFYIL